MASVLFVGTRAICRREFAGYFATSVALVFITIFLLISGLLTFYVGNFFDRGQADMMAFFNFLPWLYLFLIPAVAMRLWAEERHSGSIELLLTLPVPLASAILGKFLAAWLFIGAALSLTAPLWLTINYLGNPDNGAVLAGYVGAWLMAGAYLSLAAAVSGLTKSQVVAFVISAAACFVFTISGTPIVLDFFSDWAPPWMLSMVANTSFLSHFQSISQGVINFRDVVFFISVTVFWLFVGGVIIDHRKAE